MPTQQSQRIPENTNTYRFYISLCALFQERWKRVTQAQPYAKLSEGGETLNGNPKLHRWRIGD
jgi:hypothetical protein